MDMTHLCHCQTPRNAPDLPHIGMEWICRVTEMDDAQNPRMAPLSDSPRLQGKQCWIEIRISQLQCFTGTGNDPKETSPSQQHPGR